MAVISSLLESKLDLEAAKEEAVQWVTSGKNAIRLGLCYKTILNLRITSELDLQLLWRGLKTPDLLKKVIANKVTQ